MDTIEFRFSGGETFVANLRHWRDRLRREVHDAARREGELVASTVRAQYPERTGNLRRNVKAKDEAPDGDTVLVRVRSLAKHSHLYDKGTQRRATVRGWNRGVMPAHPVFIPEAIRRRAAFKAEVRRIMGSPEPALGSGSPDVRGSV